MSILQCSWWLRGTSGTSSRCALKKTSAQNCGMFGAGMTRSWALWGPWSLSRRSCSGSWRTVQSLPTTPCTAHLQAQHRRTMALKMTMGSPLSPATRMPWRNTRMPTYWTCSPPRPRMHKMKKAKWDPHWVDGHRQPTTATGKFQ